MKRSAEHNVTIVIPVYNDWTTLSLCIESLKKYVAPCHKVLLVNDMGPDWQELENNIQAAISGSPNFQYERNPENMGFVKTCNRAVFELDHSGNDILLLNSDTAVTEGFLEEMLEVLYSAEKHGVVCPRSNNATILTLPSHHNLEGKLTAEQSRTVFDRSAQLLPRQTVLPTGVGFAFLTKRKLLDTFGLFDEVYSPGYNEENDYCMRINQYGYSILMANHAFVYHYGEVSFGSEKRKAMDELHAKILQERYPYYPKLVQHYTQEGLDPIDYFLDLIDGSLYPKPRVLLDLYECPAAFNGTAQHCLNILNSFTRLYGDKYDISVLVQHEADEKFGISQKYKQVYFPETIRGTFHISYSPSQIFHEEHLRLLNRICLKFVICMQDIISVRSKYLLAEYGFDREDIFRRTLEYADGIVYISKFTRDDTLDYYQSELPLHWPKNYIVYNASTTTYVAGEQQDKEYQFPFEEYFAVIGNSYHHKFIRNVYPYLEKSKYNFLIIGSETTGKLSDHVYGYKSGSISDEMLDMIFAKSAGIVFPSVYEGFGLPIVNAARYQKKILVQDNSLNRELKEEFSYCTDNTYFFESLDGLEEALDRMQAGEWKSFDKSVERTWDDAAADVERALSELMAMPVDVQHLRNRWNNLRGEPVRTVNQDGPLGVKGYLKKFAFEWPKPEGKGIKAAIKKGLWSLIRFAYGVKHR